MPIAGRSQLSPAPKVAFDPRPRRSAAGLLTVDELRKNIESIGPDAYDRMTYYERWIHSISQTLIQRGVITIEELGRKMAEVQVRPKDLGG